MKNKYLILFLLVLSVSASALYVKSHGKVFYWVESLGERFSNDVDYYVVDADLESLLIESYSRKLSMEEKEYVLSRACGEEALECSYISLIIGNNILMELDSSNSRSQYEEALEENRKYIEFSRRFFYKNKDYDPLVIMLSIALRNDIQLFKLFYGETLQELSANVINDLLKKGYGFGDDRKYLFKSSRDEKLFDLYVGFMHRLSAYSGNYVESFYMGVFYNR